MTSVSDSATRHYDAEPHAAPLTMSSSVKDGCGDADVCAAPPTASAAIEKSGKPLPLSVATSPSLSTTRRTSAAQSKLGNRLEVSTSASASASVPQRRQRMPDAYPWNRNVPAAVADNIDAAVVCKGKKCTITYSASRGTLRIARVTSAGKTRTLLNIPVHIVINVETAAEREARQRVRQTNDDATKLAFATNGAGAGAPLCAFPSIRGDGSEALVFAHSRINTDVSQAGTQSGHLAGATPSQSGTYMAGTPSAVSPSAVAPLIRYYVHYVRQRNKEHPTIHTMEFQSSGPAEAVQSVVSAVVHRIYQHGSKHIIAFISAKSGKGKGEHIFEKQVRPLLHFSRHTFQVYLTKRAHDCEDYIANLENSMDNSTVVAAVGGDGMIHETVNGLHRRKLALVRWLRSVATEVEAHDTSVISLNLSLHLTDEDANSDGLDAQALATPSEETSTALPTKAGSGNGADLLHGGGAVDGGAQRPIFHETYEENKHHGRCGHSTTSSKEATAKEAQRIAQRLVQNGWDAVMPLIATVPTGSACGLAKSLDVLSIAEAALSLVHLSTVHMDLLHMSFKPNPDMVDTQRAKLDDRKYAAAKQRFAQYKSDKAAELQERKRLAAELQLPPDGVTAADASTPFLKDGSSEFRDTVSCATRMPEFRRRVAFMSLSFGVANDIDHGSEPMRWMGNARFHVYGGYMLLQGLKRYNGVLRYLPWTSKAGKTMEKLHTGSKMPSPVDFPICTMRESCPHCSQYTFDHCLATEDSAAPAGRTRSAASTLAPFTDAELLDENTVDFEDASLPWVTIRGEFCIVLMCNVRDVAQDMLMAPLAHMSDGAIDVVYSRIDPTTGRGGRVEMLKFFMGLESGAHVNLDFVNYVKASALEIKIDAGISMSDGELMPLSSVRMTKMRKSVQMVRSE